MGGSGVNFLRSENVSECKKLSFVKNLNIDQIQIKPNIILIIAAKASDFKKSNIIFTPLFVFIIDSNDSWFIILKI